VRSNQRFRRNAGVIVTDPVRAVKQPGKGVLHPAGFSF
jgi:hypothetical protein